MFVEACRRAWEELQAGTAVASGVDDGTSEAGVVKEDEVVDGRLLLRPPCRFCDYGALCGRDLEGAS